VVRGSRRRGKILFYLGGGMLREKTCQTITKDERGSISVKKRLKANK